MAFLPNKTPRLAIIACLLNCLRSRNRNNQRPVRLNLSGRLISHGIVFFFHNKTASAGLSAAKIRYRQGYRFVMGRFFFQQGYRQARCQVHIRIKRMRLIFHYFISRSSDFFQIINGRCSYISLIYRTKGFNKTLGFKIS